MDHSGTLSTLPPRCKSLTTELQLTLMDQAPLWNRLVLEIRFVISAMRADWPRMRSEPGSYFKEKVIELASLTLEKIKQPDQLRGALTAGVVLLVAVAGVFYLDGNSAHSAQPTGPADPEFVSQIISFPKEPDPLEGKGVGLNSNGRVGFNQGRGEGSLREPKQSHGGGGGGLRNPVTQQQGKLPPPSDIAAVIPALPVARNKALPVAGIDIDPALWSTYPAPAFGDPRSTSQIVSNGSGTGGGMGDGDGTGIGDGRGAGVGPGENGGTGGGPKRPGGGGPGGADGNNIEDPEKVWRGSEVQRARVLSKPEPQYTEEARRNQVMGTVVLRVVFSRSGEVINIRAIHALPYGLTERAITAARQIRFQPATRQGLPVSVHMQLEYNFNLY